MKEKVDLNKGYIDSICIEVTAPDGKAKTYTLYNFMLKKPEPVKKAPKFTIHDLDVIKGTMRRTEIYGE